MPSFPFLEQKWNGYVAFNLFSLNIRAFQKLKIYELFYKDPSR